MVTEQQAATQLNAVLAQSVTDRGAVVNAVPDVNSCGNLSGDEETFTGAQSSRQSLIHQVESDSEYSALPGAMMSDLENAWTASASADGDFAAWTEDELNNGCTNGNTGDSNYQAATTPDNEATQYKTSFAALWDPIATQYGLTSYQWDQL